MCMRDQRFTRNIDRVIGLNIGVGHDQGLGLARLPSWLNCRQILLLFVLCKTHCNFLALMRTCSHTHQLFAATASILPLTLPPLHLVDLKGYSVAVSSELIKYRYLHGAKLYVFRGERLFEADLFRERKSARWPPRCQRGVRRVLRGVAF
jgi:hypothetical protein